jgi:hypothetical protein
LTDRDVPLFGDCTWYVATVISTPFPEEDKTTGVLTPGIRTHLCNDWYFLAGIPSPLPRERSGEVGMIFWFMKAW